ncbi:MAG: transglutaminase-like domain-containing protein [Patescibacteria group bacterium]|nr:transglutaminase-like domain-containing protein [Patescibacteria group bacterium]
MKKFLVLFFLGFFYFFPTKSPLASGDFETSFNVAQTVEENGVTFINQEISLVNRLSRVYATQYGLTLESSNIRNIKAYNADGPLETKIEKEGEIITITVIFSEKTVGTGKETKFNLTYESLDLAIKNGQVWEIYVPKLSNASLIENYFLSLRVPKNFGNPAYISPDPVSTNSSQTHQIFHFNKEKLAQRGVSAAFGQFQVFDFILDYHLENTTSKKSFMEIALPPDTSYQKVYYESIKPAPYNITVDQDGNWLAQYLLGDSQKLNIEAQGKVKIFSKPQESFPTPSSLSLSDSLLPQEYWQINDSLIQTTASNLSSIKDIYDYVVSNLKYNSERVKEGAQRLGASQAIRSPNQAICTEFTDLFITLARAKGIPAREVNGYAHTTNPSLMPLGTFIDVLHAWPEYWDEEKQHWIQVDPTWGNTTNGVDYFSQVDLNHFTFSIHGKDSSYPYPAGSYKATGAGGKDVQVSFGKFDSPGEENLIVSFDVTKKIFTKIKSEGTITIENKGSSAIYNPIIDIKAENLDLKLFPDKKAAILPPFAKINLDIEIVNQSILYHGTGKVILSIDNELYTHEIVVESSVFKFILPGILILLGVFIIIFLASKLTLKKIFAKKVI